MMTDVKKLVEELTLEEKASLCIGGDFWHTRAVERLGIPSVMLTDGPFGLRKQSGKSDHLGMNQSDVAIAFPAGVTMASSYDPSIAKEVGNELGRICQKENVAVILGPAMNIKRSPLCGRNFEYYSEDPKVSSEIATGLIQGIQEEGVGSSAKHYLANNQEYFRITSNSIVDERTLRELYLASFEGAVKNGKPWTVMCSYNKINGTYACENKKYLTDILRDEWGFDGFVMTDWGALDIPGDSILAGLNLGMPGPGIDNVNRIIQAVKDGSLPEEKLNQSVEQLLTVLYRYIDHHKKDAEYDFDLGHAMARKAAEESAVLLKNEEEILPLKVEEDVLYVGPFAKEPRYQGGGSSHTNPYRISNALEEGQKVCKIAYAQGFTMRDRVAPEDEELKQEALQAARTAKKVVIFAGLPEAYESEGFDRKHMGMPEKQNQFIIEMAQVNPNIVVVLHNGSPVEMPWIDSVKAVLEMYLGGEATGEATHNLLYGLVNPSGKLAETFPLRLEDNPTYPYYGVERDDVTYREGILVGYRYYETMKKPVLFPFGHGLSYTSFSYENLTLSKKNIKDTEDLQVQVTVKNTGNTYGKEVVQLYVSGKTKGIVRPERELRQFTKVGLDPGEETTVTFHLSKRDFAYWNTKISDWHATSGTYQIQIGKNASEILLSDSVEVESTTVIKPHFTLNSPLGDLWENPISYKILTPIFAAMMPKADEMGKTATGEKDANTDEKKMEAPSDEAFTEEANLETGKAMALRSLLSFSDKMTAAGLQGLVDKINAEIEKQDSPCE